MASSDRLVPFWPKILEISRAQPAPALLAQVMDLPASKIITHRKERGLTVK
jgi:hypothetical protein